MTKHSPEEQRKCSEPNAKTFVDDAVIQVRKQDDKSLEESVVETMGKVEEYMKANRMALNSEERKNSSHGSVEKSRTERKKFKIILNNKVILGNTISSSLTWEAHVSKVLLPQLTNMTQMLKLVAKYLPPGFRALYSNSVFHSKLMFGIETWGVPPKLY